MVQSEWPLSASYSQPTTPVYNGSATYFRDEAINTTGEIIVGANGARKYGVVLINESGEDGWVANSVADLAVETTRMLLPAANGGTYTPIVVIGQGAVAVAAGTTSVAVSGYWI